MGIFFWSQSLYGTGIAKMDEQHRNIFAISNSFYEACTTLRGQHELSKLFTDLIEHAVEHFALEESLMTQYSYPEQTHHAEIHREIMNMLAERRARFDAGETGMAGEMLEFLRNWLVEHVTTEDSKLAQHLIQRMNAS